MEDIIKIREKIAESDKIIAEQLINRMNLVTEITEYKKQKGIPILQLEQENKQRLVFNEKIKDYIHKDEVLDVFNCIVKNSKRIQTKALFSYNIMIIGFMGVGKTTVSAYLKDLLAMEEEDTDALVIAQEKMSVNDIFKEYGEIYFRNCESNVLIELQKRKQTIVSCGGGIVMRDENVEMMKKNAKIILLTADPQTIIDRIGHHETRPILNGNMNIEFISELMEKRKQIYLNAADIVVDTNGKTVHQICEDLIYKLIKFSA